MDGTTEPVVAVIGHPIAGNPSQFALERALAAMELDWRVLSFDVQPEKVAVALDGAEVLGINGILIDGPLTDVASNWYQRNHPSEKDRRIDCLHRGDDGRLHGYHEQHDWLAETIAGYFERLGREIGGRLWLGDFDGASRIRREGFSGDTKAPPLPDDIAKSDLIVIKDSDGQPTVLEVDDWPSCDSQTLVVDLTDGHPEIQRIKNLGYQVIGSSQRRIGTLLKCLQRWTGSKPSSDVIHDAIEEYLAV